MAPRHSFASRVILVIAVVGCLMGMGHTHATAQAAPSVAMSHAMPDHAAGHAPSDAPSDAPAGHHNQGTDCCAATLGDALLGASALPVTFDHTALTPPAVIDGHAVALAPPQPRPPDLCSLCVART